MRYYHVTGTFSKALIRAFRPSQALLLFSNVHQAELIVSIIRVSDRSL